MLYRNCLQHQRNDSGKLDKIIFTSNFLLYTGQNLKQLISIFYLQYIHSARDLFDQRLIPDYSSIGEHHQRKHSHFSDWLKLSNTKTQFLNYKILNLRYAWLGKSWLKSFLSSVDSKKVFFRSALCPQITMVPTQLSICLLFVPRTPHHRVFKISSSSTHTIGLNGRNVSPLIG